MGGWLARHRTIKKMGRPHRLDVLSMGTEQCAVVLSSVVALMFLNLELLSSVLSIIACEQSKHRECRRAPEGEQCETANKGRYC